MLHLSSRALNWEPPLRALDSSVEDAVFFGARGLTVLGVGAAQEMGPDWGDGGRRAGAGVVRERVVSNVDASKIPGLIKEAWH